LATAALACKCPKITSLKAAVAALTLKNQTALASQLIQKISGALKHVAVQFATSNMTAGHLLLLKLLPGGSNEGAKLFRLVGRSARTAG
jgi:hypothetical protein